jgi:hypothetical protein
MLVSALVVGSSEMIGPVYESRPLSSTSPMACSAGSCDARQA